MMSAAWAPLDPYASLGLTRPVTPPMGVTGADPERTTEMEDEQRLPRFVTPPSGGMGADLAAREPELLLPEPDT